MRRSDGSCSVLDGFVGRVGGSWSYVFFFSSRRRHTRSDRDWSSDVCSSDLRAGEAPWRLHPVPDRARGLQARARIAGPAQAGGAAQLLAVNPEPDLHALARALLDRKSVV